MAEQLVRKALNAGDQQRLVETFVTDVARPATPTATGAAVSAAPTPVTTPARSAV
jgi:hypothetical protein